MCLQGAELATQEGQSAAALAACRTLAEELSELRFPAPRILSFRVSFPVLNLNFHFQIPTAFFLFLLSTLPYHSIVSYITHVLLDYIILIGNFGMETSFALKCLICPLF